MINNLFSIFDPSSSNFSLLWINIILPLALFFNNKIKINFKWNIFIKIFISQILKEIKPLLKDNMKKGIKISILGVFIFIIISNIIALIPFIFTPTAHIILSFPTRVAFWIRFILYGWIKNTKNIIAHTVPTGTPIILINFMVLIELVRNIIRPLTLSIRLSANIVAGHLLLSLLRNFAISNFLNIILMYPILLILRTLEIGVAIIQAYVFITLISLYTTEIH